MDMNWMFLVDAGIGLLMAGLGIPMMLRKVKPNYFYGFRTKKTLSDEKIWYEANAYAGRLLLWIGSIMLVLGLLLYLINAQGKPNLFSPEVTSTLTLVLIFAPLALLLGLSLGYLKKL